MTVQPIAVTSVTGAVGGAVARLVTGEGHPVRLLVRNPSRLPHLGEVDGDTEVAVAEYGAPDAAAALTGVQTLFMVSAAESATRVAEHENFIRAAAVLADPSAHAGATYDLTGPHALDLDEIAAILTEVRGRPFRYQPETLAEAHASREKYDPQPFEMDAWVSTYTAIATGELDVVSEDVRTLTGQNAMTFEELVRSATTV